MNILKKSKKGDGGLSSTLVIMVAAMIGLLVLILVTASFGKLFKTVTGKNECQIEFLVSSFTKTGGVQTVEPSCEPHLVTIDKAYLDNNRARADKTIDTYGEKYQSYAGKNKAYDEYTQRFAVSGDGPLNEWIIDEAFAKEMKSCWDMTGRGKLDLFSNWKGMIECKNENEDGFHPCEDSEMVKMYQDHGTLSTVAGVVTGVVLTWRSKLTLGVVGGSSAAGIAPLLVERIKGNIQAGTPPTYCVLCSRIKFSEDTPFTQGNIGVWLANTPVTDIGLNSKVSYAQYLQNDEFKGVFADSLSYKYDTSKNYAVVYARINVFKSEELFYKIIDKATPINIDPKSIESIQMIKVVPYQELKDQCTLLVG